jgi:hypothetical protein
MPSQDKLFLQASITSSHALTDLFDFVWPNAVALWNLQWQAKGFLEQIPHATVNDLEARFVTGSGIRGANLRRLAHEKSWADMQQWFSRLLLSEACALFEGWIEAALDELKLPEIIRKKGTKNALDKKLQFPSEFNAAGTATNGVRYAIDAVQGTGSPLIQTCFQPTQALNKKNNQATLEQLLICYRAFKEVRNDFTHHGGQASQLAKLAFDKYSSESAATLGVKEKPELPPITAGNEIQLSLRGVVGFSDVVLRLIATLDYLLSDSKYAEGVIRRNWKAKQRGLITVKPAGSGSNHQLTKLIQSCGLPKPVNQMALYNYLNGMQLVA